MPSVDALVEVQVDVALVSRGRIQSHELIGKHIERLYA
jgi:hypothetical protein